jgi:hypothetical protein
MMALMLRMAEYSLAGTTVRIAIMRLSIALLLAATSPPARCEEFGAADVEGELLARVGSGFRTWKTDHFIIAYDTPVEAIRALVGRLEGIYDAVLRFRDGNRINGEIPPRPLPVIFYAAHDDFVKYLSSERVRAASVAGVYLQEPNLSAFCHTLDTPPLRPLVQQIDRLEQRFNRTVQSDQRDTRTRRDNTLFQLNALRTQRDALVRRFDRVVIQHEAAHQVLFNLGIHARGATNPDWLVEGLACQFETAQPARGGTLTEVNHLRLADFRATLALPPNARSLAMESWEEALSAGRLVSIRTLVSDPEVIRDSGDAISLRYAQSWALVHFLHREKRTAFADYLRVLAGREARRAVSADEELTVFERHFGHADEHLDVAMCRFVVGLRFDPRNAD